MDIPSLFMIPSAVSSGKVHSVFPNSTDADFDFNRDSSATRVNSQGLIETVGYFGSELVTNGSFDADSNWSKGTGWSIANGKASKVAGSAAELTQASVFPSGFLSKTFRITFTLEVTAGSVRLRAGTNSQSYLNSSGTYSYTLTPAGNDQLKFDADSSFAGSVDNVSCKEITGDRARLNYEIEGGLVNTKPSLLLEPQSTNLIEYSQDFTTRGGKWQTLGDTTKELDTIISPDGTRNAATIKGLDGAGSNDFRYAFSFNTANKSVTYSVYLKGSGTLRLQVSNGVDQAFSNTITLSNEWQRYSVSGAFNSTSVSTVYLVIDDYVNLTATEYDIWGAQFEEQSYATSYIPTNGSTQTRAAETCNGAGTSSILPSSDGIFYAEIAALANDGTSRVISLSDGSNTNRIHLLYFSQNNFISANYRVSGSTQAFVNVNLSNALLFHKIAWHFRSGKFKLFIDGSLAGSNSNTTMLGAGVINELAFNEAPSSTPFYGKIRDLRVYNTKEMTDSEVDILLTKITS